MTNQLFNPTCARLDGWCECPQGKCRHERLHVLIGCEYSGRMRDAFRRLGHLAWSNDWKEEPEGEFPQHHLRGDVRRFLDRAPDGAPWDMGIFHPDCTFLTNSGVRWLYGKNGGTASRDPERWRNMEAGAAFFRELLGSDIPFVGVENPVMHGYAKALVGRGPDQIVQPWWFGDGFTKATGWWLKNLPLLVPTNIVKERKPAVWLASPGPERWKERSRTYPGHAAACALQWGNHVRQERLK